MARVEITGSSIKRIAKEGSLPVQTLTRADIDQSGASNVDDLVAQLPSMQGFITSSTSVNGGGNGVQTASIHAIGTQYTLVLLNGRRMAPFARADAFQDRARLVEPGPRAVGDFAARRRQRHRPAG